MNVEKGKNSNKAAAKQENIWQEILNSAMTKKDLEESNVFIFGDKFTGKRSLVKMINKELLQKGELEEQRKILNTDNSVAKFGLLDYTFLNIKKIAEQDTDSIGKMNIWISNEMFDRDMFESMIQPERLLKSACVIVVDLSRPWEIMENLKRWINLVYDTFSSLLLKIPFDKQQELRDSIEGHVKLYEEPQFDEEGNFKKEEITEETKSFKLQLALKEGVLKTNLGIPVIIVVNKSDIVNQATERRRYEEDSEYIVKHIRNFALTYGATIIYTSAKPNINLNILYEYILHRIYKFEFRHKANIMDKDSYFVPSGYDSLPVLKSFDIRNDLKTIFDERISPVKQKSLVKEEEVTCEDLNLFLKRFIDKTKKYDDKLNKLQSGLENKVDYTSSAITQASDVDSKAKLSLLSSKEPDKENSANKVNFDIFKQSTAGSSSKVVENSESKMSTEEKLQAYRKKQQELLFDKKPEQVPETREKFHKKLNMLRINARDNKDNPKENK